MKKISISKTISKGKDILQDYISLALLVNKLKEFGWITHILALVLIFCLFVAVSLPNVEATELVDKQTHFTVMVKDLLDYAQDQGILLTFGDAYRDSRCEYGQSDSLHQLRLAIDLNIHKDGVYQTSTEAHKVLGEYWESLGGSWGGRFGDGNHYELRR